MVPAKMPVVDEFGWDLSAEDEELLSTLADDSATTSFAAVSRNSPRPPYSPSDSGSDTTVTTLITGRRPRSRRFVRNFYTDLDSPSPAGSRTVGAIPDIESVAETLSLDGGCAGGGRERIRAARERRVATASDGPDAGRQELGSETCLSGDVKYPDLTDALSNVPSGIEAPPEPEPWPASIRAANQPAAFAPPARSPLIRFRTFPRKPFTVTDFTSGVWCELQHEYTLTHLPGGKKAQNHAMRGGSRVHQKLEDEVHRTVHIDILTKEDAFGLKLWNIIQGLRTLRDEGLTREMEVWGLVDGHVVNGLIDSLSLKHPDPDFEEELNSGRQSSQEGADRTRRITEFFSTTKSHDVHVPGGKARETAQPTRSPAQRVWLTDVKTRGWWSLPSGPALRSTRIQLFLYHRFLSTMAACDLDYLHVFRRYGLDPDEMFSDLFQAQIGSLHDEIFRNATSSIPGSPASSAVPPSTETGGGGSEVDTTTSAASTTSSSERLRYLTLRSLIPLLNAEMRKTFPHGAASLGSVVTVEYRYRGRQRPPAGGDEWADDAAAAEESKLGRVIGHQTICVDDDSLQAWLDFHMEWWRGDRAAQGVPIEEADKCRHCDFADGCEWRAANHRKLVAQARERSVGGVVKTTLDKKWRAYG